MKKDYPSNLRLVTEELLKNLYDSSDSVKQADIDKIIKVAPQIVQQRQKAKRDSGKNPSKANSQLEVSSIKSLSVQSSLKMSQEKQKRILELADETQGRTPREANSLVFMAKPFVQTTLPHRDPGNVPEWYRRNGNLTLSVRPGWGDDPITGERKCYGVPYGIIPRLFLMWMSTEVFKTKNRYLELGKSLSEFMRELNLDPTHGGKNSPIARLKNQIQRLLMSSISLDQKVIVDNKTMNRFMNMNIAREGVLEWYPDNAGLPEPLEDVLEGSWIRLSEEFHECLTISSVPLDMRVINEIKQSPLALDLYAWMTHRTHGYAPSDSSPLKPSFITWSQLHCQFGSNYKNIKDFKKEVKHILRTVQTASNNLLLEEGRGGLYISKKMACVK